MPEEQDKINHPYHYAHGREHEPIAVIEDWQLNFNLGNVLKYVSRIYRKGDTINDLKKAQFYLNREIERMEKEADVKGTLPLPTDERAAPPRLESPADSPGIVFVDSKSPPSLKVP